MDDGTQPLYAMTQAVLAALDRGSYVALEPLTTPDLTFVDTGADAGPAVVHDRAALRAYLAGPRGRPHATTILAYDGRPDHLTGWSVVRLRRSIEDDAMGGVHHELCSATLLWRLTPDGWKLSRWHCTSLRTEAAG